MAVGVYEEHSCVSMEFLPKTTLLSVTFIYEAIGSFPSQRDIYLHIIFVVDAYINYALQGNPNYPSLNYNEYDSIEKVTKYLEQVESKASGYLSKVTPEELARNIERKQKDGSTFPVPVEDILLDFFQEETHHRGELIALLWQMDVAPPHMGFVQYLRSQTGK